MRARSACDATADGRNVPVSQRATVTWCVSSPGTHSLRRSAKAAWVSPKRLLKVRIDSGVRSVILGDRRGCEDHLSLGLRPHSHGDDLAGFVLLGSNQVPCSDSVKAGHRDREGVVIVIRLDGSGFADLAVDLDFVVENLLAAHVRSLRCVVCRSNEGTITRVIGPCTPYPGRSS